MIQFIEIRFQSPALRSEHERITRALLDAGVSSPSPGASATVSVRLPDNPATVAQVERLLREAGIHLWTRRRAEFSAADAAAARWLRLTLTRHGKGEPQRHTAFNNDAACPRCGVGRRPSGPVCIERAALPPRENIAAAATGEIFIGASLAAAIERLTGSTGELLPVRDAATGRPLDWRCIWPRTVLPPMDPASIGIEHGVHCTRCGRDGYFWSGDADLVLAYRSFGERSNGRAVEHAGQDFLATWEHFGHCAEDASDRTQRGFRAAVPLVIVSQRIRSALGSAARGHWALTPVIRADDAGPASDGTSHVP